MDRGTHATAPCLGAQMFGAYKPVLEEHEGTMILILIKLDRRQLNMN